MLPSCFKELLSGRELNQKNHRYTWSQHCQMQQNRQKLLYVTYYNIVPVALKFNLNWASSQLSTEQITQTCRRQEPQKDEALKIPKRKVLKISRVATSTQSRRRESKTPRAQGLVHSVSLVLLVPPVPLASSGRGIKEKEIASRVCASPFLQAPLSQFLFPPLPFQSLPPRPSIP